MVSVGIGSRQEAVILHYPLLDFLIAVADALFKVIAENLKEGYGLQTEYFSFVSDVTGVFEDENDRFDPARHEVTLSLRLGAPMKEALRQVKVTVIPHNTPMPVIKKVFDRKSKTTNDILTPGHTLEISGDLLNKKTFGQCPKVFLCLSDKSLLFTISLEARISTYSSFE